MSFPFGFTGEVLYANSKTGRFVSRIPANKEKGEVVQIWGDGAVAVSLEFSRIISPSFAEPFRKQLIETLMSIDKETL